MNDTLINALIKNKDNFSDIFNLDMTNIVILDLSDTNPGLSIINIKNPEEFNNYIKSKITKSRFAIGRYAEDRNIYSMGLFSGTAPRTVHLGLDLWTEPGIEIFSPLSAKVHSFANNAQKGDYGPTIILEHELDGIKFYTLYGHLSLDSLNDLKTGNEIEKGQSFAKIGNYPTNGNWPPHLHFQIIRDMQGKSGDFPGVASKETAEEFLHLCPNPNLILNIKGLD